MKTEHIDQLNYLINNMLDAINDTLTQIEFDKQRLETLRDHLVALRGPTVEEGRVANKLQTAMNRTRGVDE